MSYLPLGSPAARCPPVSLIGVERTHTLHSSQNAGPLYKRTEVPPIPVEAGRKCVSEPILVAFVPILDGFVSAGSRSTILCRLLGESGELTGRHRCRDDSRALFISNSNKESFYYWKLSVPARIYTTDLVVSRWNVGKRDRLRGSVLRSPRQASRLHPLPWGALPEHVRPDPRAGTVRKIMTGHATTRRPTGRTSPRAVPRTHTDCQHSLQQGRNTRHGQTERWRGWRTDNV